MLGGRKELALLKILCPMPLYAFDPSAWQFSRPHQIKNVETSPIDISKEKLQGSTTMWAYLPDDRLIDRYMVSSKLP